MTTKEISRRAGRIFNNILPANWAVRSQEDQEDYGIDYEIEITTPDDQPTGFIFKLQQKGQVEPEITADAIIFRDMKLKKLKYYLQDIGIPVVFVLVDVGTETCYWTALQGNAEIERAYRDATERNQEKTTIKVPVGNQLPETQNKLLNAVVEMLHWLFIRQARACDPERVVRAAAANSALDSAVDALGRHRDVLRCGQIEQKIQAGDVPQALRIAQTLFDGESETPEMRLAAALYILRIEGGIAARSGDASERDRFLRRRVEIAQRALSIARRMVTALHVRLYARFMLRSARFRLLSERDFGLYLSHQIQQAAQGGYAEALTRLERIKTSRATLRELQRAQDAIGRLVERGYVELLPQAWSQLAGDSTYFVARLRLDHLDETAERIVNWLDRSGHVAAHAAEILKQWADLSYCALQQVPLAKPDDDADLVRRDKQARELLAKIPDGDIRRDAEAQLESFKSINMLPKKTPSHEEAIDAYKTMAASMGIDLSDPNDRIAQIVNIGLRDLDPSRVLRKCKNLIVALGPSGLPADMLGLPTAGSKWLLCTKHGQAMMALALDGLYESFQSMRCKDCPECQPRSAEWQWNEEWQRDQEQEHRELIERIRDV